MPGPTVSQTLHAIRGAAEVNSAALDSISGEIPAWLTLVEAWNPTLMKGQVRDQLARALQAYRDAREQALRLVAVTTQAIDEIGTGGDPDQLPPSVPWSTGELQIAFGKKGKPAAAQELGRYTVVEDVTWDASISLGNAAAPAADQADVTFWLDGQPMARFRWLAGATHPLVTVLIADAAPGQEIVVTAPDVPDLTFANFSGTLVGRRRGT